MRIAEEWFDRCAAAAAAAAAAPLNNVTLDAAINLSRRRRRRRLCRRLSSPSSSSSGWMDGCHGIVWSERRTARVDARTDRGGKRQAGGGSNCAGRSGMTRRVVDGCPISPPSLHSSRPLLFLTASRWFRHRRNSHLLRDDDGEGAGNRRLS